MRHRRAFPACQDQLVVCLLLWSGVERAAANAIEDEAVPRTECLGQVSLVPLQERRVKSAGDHGVAPGCLIALSDVCDLGTFILTNTSSGYLPDISKQGRFLHGDKKTWDGPAAARLRYRLFASSVPPSHP